MKTTMVCDIMLNSGTSPWIALLHLLKQANVKAMNSAIRDRTAILCRPGEGQVIDNKEQSNLVTLAKVKFTTAINPHALRHKLSTIWGQKEISLCGTL